MKKFSFWPAIVLSFITLVTSAYFGIKIINSADSYKEEKTKITEILDFNDRLLNISEAIPMFGDYIWGEKAAAYTELLSNANLLYQEAQYFGWILLVILLFALLLFYLIYQKTNKWFGISFGLLILAIVFLSVGLFSPMLELEAFKENLSLKLQVNSLDVIASVKQLEQNTIVQSLGLSEYLSDGIETLKSWLPEKLINFKKVYPDRMYFFYQNKGIFDLVEVLWTKGSIPMAVIIGLFSIIIPILKLGASFLMLFSKNQRKLNFSKVIAYLTKFSMLDVFVAASFVSYFSFSQINTGVETESRVLIGLYFFTAYVFTAILLGISLRKLNTTHIEN